MLIVGFYTEVTIENINSLFFYAFIFEGGVKFGLTKQDSIYKRWHRNVIEELLFFEPLASSVALDLERSCKTTFVCLKNEKLKTTEFTYAPKDTFIDFILEKINV